MFRSHYIDPTILQLVAARGLNNTVLALKGTTLNLLLALPVESLETLAEMRVGEVVTSVDRVGVHGAEVLDVQLEQGAAELLGVAQVGGEVVGLEFVVAGEHVHEQLHEGVHRGEGIIEEQEADDDGTSDVEPERRVQRGIVDENREEGEDVQKMRLGIVSTRRKMLHECE